MSIGERAVSAARRLWRLPCKLMLVTIALCLGAREWYPFSPFPMYAGFGPSAWYICVTDAAGQPLPTGRYLGLDATILRRVYETRQLARVAAGAAPDAAAAAAARETLEFVVREARPSEPGAALPARLGLQRMALRLADGRVERAPQTLAMVGGE